MKSWLKKTDGYVVLFHSDTKFNTGDHVCVEDSHVVPSPARVLQLEQNMGKDNIQTLKKENNDLKVQLENLKQDLQRLQDWRDEVTINKQRWKRSKHGGIACRSREVS